MLGIRPWEMDLLTPREVEFAQKYLAEMRKAAKQRRVP